MDWKDKVTSMSERVFPGISQNFEDCNFGNEVLSNLPLQMSLYFNVIFAPVWMLIITLHLRDHYLCYSEMNRFIVTTIVTVVFLVEILRLYLGYKGNLEDKIPELAGFWMLSLLIQFPLQSFLLFNPSFELRVVEIVVQTVIFTMILTQLVFSYTTLKTTAAHQANYFRIMKLRSDVTVADIQESYKMKRR